MNFEELPQAERGEICLFVNSKPGLKCSYYGGISGILLSQLLMLFPGFFIARRWLLVGGIMGTLNAPDGGMMQRDYATIVGMILLMTVVTFYITLAFNVPSYTPIWKKGVARTKGLLERELKVKISENVAVAHVLAIRVTFPVSIHIFAAWTGWAMAYTSVISGIILPAAAVAFSLYLLSEHRRRTRELFDCVKRGIVYDPFR